MSKSKGIRIIELVLQVVTIISGILAIISMVKDYKYKRCLKEKAQAYLAEELGELQDVKRTVSVFSPKIEEQEKQIKKILMLTGISAAALIIINLFKRD